MIPWVWAPSTSSGYGRARAGSAALQRARSPTWGPLPCVTTSWSPRASGARAEMAAVDVALLDLSLGRFAHSRLGVAADEAGYDAHAHSGVSRAEGVRTSVCARPPRIWSFRSSARMTPTTTAMMPIVQRDDDFGDEADNDDDDADENHWRLLDRVVAAGLVLTAEVAIPSRRLAFTVT